jgi:hypothetical protein
LIHFYNAVRTTPLNTRPRCSKSSNISKLAQAGDSKIAPLSIKILAIQGEDPTTSGNIQGKTIVIDGTNITWSQAGRTQKRHTWDIWLSINANKAL